ncbi:MAG: DUF421 domain-containing protein [bacterium]|nr:DUF421 domain-containing protein [bacterium]
MNIDFSELLDVTIRAVSSLITLFLITKLIGKKQVSQLSLFDYVIGISIGNFAAEMTINLESTEINGIWAVVLFGLFAYLISYLTMKSIVLRRFFMGTPTIIIQDGKILEKSLKKERLDINEMLEEIRSNGYFDLSQIEYAIMESNGKLSIMPKTDYRPLTPKDMDLKLAKESLCANIIIDGKIMHQSLKYMGKDEKWLKKELKVKGYTDFSDILLATLDINEKIVVYERNQNDKILNILE